MNPAIFSGRLRGGGEIIEACPIINDFVWEMIWQAPEGNSTIITAINDCVYHQDYSGRCHRIDKNGNTTELPYKFNIADVGFGGSAGIRLIGLTENIIFAYNQAGYASRSLDNGMTWTRLPRDLGVVASGTVGGNMVVEANTTTGAMVAVKGTGYASYSNDFGASWFTLPRGLNTTTTSGTTFERIVNVGNNWIVCGTNGYWSRSLNNGATWTGLVKRPYVFNNYFVEGDAIFLWGAEMARNFTAGDGGWSISAISSLMASNAKMYRIGGNLVITAAGGRNYISYDNGTTWVENLRGYGSSIGGAPNYSGLQANIFKLKNNEIWLYLYDTLNNQVSIMKTFNNGMTWIEQSGTNSSNNDYWKNATPYAQKVNNLMQTNSSRCILIGGHTHNVNLSQISLDSRTVPISYDAGQNWIETTIPDLPTTGVVYCNFARIDDDFFVIIDCPAFWGTPRLFKLTRSSLL